MNSFFEQYHPVFEVVCRILGNGWRVNKLDDCPSRIKLTSPQFKNYSVHIRMEKDRFSVVGSVDSRSWSSPYHVCTLSRKRNPVDIAANIERKILLNASQEVLQAIEYEKRQAAKKDEILILKGMLSQLVQLESWYGALTGFKAENGLNGKVTEQGERYDLLIRGLSIDQLVKITGYLKQL
ncbi:hypothetical protein [Escherichia coli]|uniref:hypothetical protein n=1 Tax=Escherichia coli TaxID=562 RepID=UPI002231CE3E|nr:hypothetical protein [Escherichia coli]MCW3832514.1 hypothetical protein [Escherichia coli]